MKVFVFTYDRPETITTSRMLEDAGVDHTVLCHDEATRQRYIDAGNVLANRIVATEVPRGLANNRNAALELLDHAEWGVFLVDDMKRVTELGDYDTRIGARLGITMDNQKTLAPLFKKEIPLSTFVERCKETAKACDSVGAYLGGFAGIDNPLYRDAKWKFNTFSDGRAWVVKKSGLRFDLEAQMMDDAAWNAKNIERFGTIVNNQWVLPDCKRYSAGSYGTMEERIPQKLREAAFLTNRYPGILATKKKAGQPDGSHVVLRRSIPTRLLPALEAAAINATNK